MDKRIGFGPRLGAWLIDLVAVCILVGIVAVLFGGMLGVAAGAQLEGNKAENEVAGGIIGAFAGILLAAPVVGALYFAIEGFTGATPGKMLLGLRIGTDSMTPAPLSKLLLRYALKHPHFVLGTLGVFTFSFLSTLGVYLGPIAFLGSFLALGEKKQALHDLIAGTAVYPRSALESVSSGAPAAPSV
jgi:uncharacterized RDD family membrane protein YckC